jgi:hypothetical protein
MTPIFSSYYAEQNMVGGNKKGGMKLFWRERKNIKKGEIGKKTT